MIIDTLKNCNLYCTDNEKFKKAFAFLQKATSENLSVGKYEIDGEDVYAMVQEYTTKPYEDGRFEGHRKYIDIQYIVSGDEKIEVVDISKVTPNTEYNAEKDLLFFENCKNVTTTVLQTGEYGVFFPHDIHKPGLAVQNIPSPVKKVVVKVSV